MCLPDLDNLFGVTHDHLPGAPVADDPAAITRQRMIDAVRRDGRYMGGAAPYGYYLVRGSGHGPRGAARGKRSVQHLWPDDTEAPILREIFQRTLAGDGQTTLIRDLNRRRVPPPADHKAIGWNVQAISTILDNPCYSGYEFWRPYNAGHQPGLAPQLYGLLVRSDRPVHPALVSIQDFLAVAIIRAAPTKPRRSRTSRAQPAMLHRVSCAVCGRTRSVSSKEGRVRYRCRPTPPGQHGSHQRSVYLSESRVFSALGPWLRRHTSAMAHRGPPDNPRRRSSSTA